jgi:hypothetical protein
VSERRHSGWWVVAAFVPLGLGTWAGFAYAGSVARVRRWQGYAVVYAVAVAAGFVLAGTYDKNGTFGHSLAGALLLVPWAFGIGHAFVARPLYLRRANGGPSEIELAEQRLAMRDKARKIAREDPRLALELGIGRPELSGVGAGLIDVNHATAHELIELPRADQKLAEQIVKVREEVGGFDSIEDMGMTLDLPGDVVEDMRDRAVFLPR